MQVTTTDIASESTESFQWKIKRWSLLPAQQGEKTKCATMKCAGHKWFLGVYPGGQAEKPDDDDARKALKKLNVGLYLHYEESEEVVKAKYSLSIVNQLPNKPNRISGGDKNFSKNYSQPSDISPASWGSYIMIKQSDIADETKGFKLNDCVIIEAKITIYGELQSTVECAPVYVPAETLKADLSQLLTSGMNSDVPILLNSSDESSSSNSGSSSSSGHSFQAHSSILIARSPYFRAMMSSPMTESTTHQITEYDVEPAVFEEVLNYIYSDSLSEGALAAMGEWLLLAANKYGLEALKQLYEGQLCQSLSVNNASARLVLSDQAEADQLKEASVGFIKVNAAEVMQTSGWTSVTSQNALLLEVMQAVVGVQGGEEANKKRSAEEEETSKATELAKVDEMTVAALRSALAGKSLDTSGKKAELAGRLKLAIQGSVDGQ
jgi:speckle-type POZ protein